MRLKSIQFLFLVVCLFFLCSCGKSGSNPKVKIQEIERNFYQVNDNIFVSRGTYYSVNMVMIIDENNATIIDTGYDAVEANRFVDYMTEHNITLKNIIFTHDHDDHTNNQELFPNVEHVYHFKDTTDHQIITMGEQKMEIIHTSGHFNDEHQSVLLNDTILIAGDVVEVDMYLVKEKTVTLQTLKTTLETLNETKYDAIIPGHGAIGVGNKILKMTLDKVSKELEERS